MPAETRIQTQAEVEEKMVDLPSEGNSVDVEVKEAPTVVNSETDETIDVGEKEVAPAASETEVEDYGKKVQSRIDKLTKRLRESERREAAAIQYAQGVQTDAEQIRSKARTLDAGYVGEFATRVEAETNEAKKALKSAVELGDSDAQVEAQQKLARLAIEAERVKSTQAQRERLKKEMQARGVDPNQPQMPQQPQYPQQAPPPPPPDPKAESWAEKNKWFGEDEPMTLTSFSIHRKLVEEGLDPSSDEYYNEIDKRMKDTFPHRFDNETKSSTPTQTVASANRGGPIRRKGTVRLTPSQVAISKKLGVPLSEYAKYVKE
jgi:hypothetical protein